MRRGRRDWREAALLNVETVGLLDGRLRKAREAITRLLMHDEHMATAAEEQDRAFARKQLGKGD